MIALARAEAAVSIQTLTTDGTREGELKAIDTTLEVCDVRCII